MKTIKSKINLGVIFLFSVIVIIGILGIFFINQLAERSGGTIKENYLSVDYMMKLLASIDDMNTYHMDKLSNKADPDKIESEDYLNSKNSFETNLDLETRNITESGESEIVNELHAGYRKYMSLYQDLQESNSITGKDLNLFHDQFLEVRTRINDIYKINIDAISRENTKTQNTADNITQYMSIIVTISILVTLSFVYSFSSRITEPIKELTGRIKSISEHNYDQKLNINSNDEFGELAAAFNTMAERLKIYEAKHIDEILFEKKRMESLVQNFEDGVLLIDEFRKVAIVNETILRITGLKEDEVLNHDVSGIILQNDLFREIISYASEVKSGVDSESKPLRIILDGRETYYKPESEDIITYSESSGQETFIGTLILLRNITSFQERDTAKTNLLATVSHELKTPLSSINLSLKLLGDTRIGDLNNEQKEIIASLRQQGSRLSKVINELLDYSQIETGNIRLRTASVKPEDIIDLSATALMMQMSDKNIQLDTSIEESLPSIKADLEKTVWVLINLLNNAIRYSRQDGIIKLNVKKENGGVIFSVKDNGPGISKEDQEKIFQRFTRVGNISKTGWGLGLAIAREFVQAQGGRIWVESEEGSGSQFFFSLPEITGA
jgi:signal transduction histidine kinase